MSSLWLRLWILVQSRSAAAAVVHVLSQVALAALVRIPNLTILACGCGCWYCCEVHQYLRHLPLGQLWLMLQFRSRIAAVANIFDHIALGALP